MRLSWKVTQKVNMIFLRLQDWVGSWNRVISLRYFRRKCANAFHVSVHTLQHCGILISYSDYYTIGITGKQQGRVMKL